jgi:hypothetical protein
VRWLGDTEQDRFHRVRQLHPRCATGSQPEHVVTTAELQQEAGQPPVLIFVRGQKLTELEGANLSSDPALVNQVRPGSVPDAPSPS